MEKFRLFQVAVKFFKKCKNLTLPKHLKDQLDRASASISLNLSEGYGRIAKLEKRRFYRIALGSTRECKTVFLLAEIEDPELLDMVDFLAAGLYKLAR